MKRTYDPVIDHFDLAPIHRETVIRNLFRAVRRPIRRALIRREIADLALELRVLAALKVRAWSACHERAVYQIVEQEEATRIALARLVEELNELERGE